MKENKKSKEAKTKEESTQPLFIPEGWEQCVLLKDLSYKSAIACQCGCKDVVPLLEIVKAGPESSLKLLAEFLFQPKGFAIVNKKT